MSALCHSSHESSWVTWKCGGIPKRKKLHLFIFPCSCSKSCPTVMPACTPAKRCSCSQVQPCGQPGTTQKFSPMRNYLLASSLLVKEYDPPSPVLILGEVSPTCSHTELTGGQSSRVRWSSSGPMLTRPHKISRSPPPTVKVDTQITGLAKLSFWVQKNIWTCIKQNLLMSLGELISLI